MFRNENVLRNRKMRKMYIRGLSRETDNNDTTTIEHRKQPTSNIELNIFENEHIFYFSLNQHGK